MSDVLYFAIMLVMLLIWAVLVTVDCATPVGKRWPSLGGVALALFFWALVAWTGYYLARGVNGCYP